MLCQCVNGYGPAAVGSTSRHKLDSGQPYDQLLRDIRQVEKKLKLSEPLKSKTHLNFIETPHPLQQRQEYNLRKKEKRKKVCPKQGSNQCPFN